VGKDFIGVEAMEMALAHNDRICTRSPPLKSTCQNFNAKAEGLQSASCDKDGKAATVIDGSNFE
jgi:hypothetical protein